MLKKDCITRDRSAAIAALDEQLWITDQRRGMTEDSCPRCRQTMFFKVPKKRKHILVFFQLYTSCFPALEKLFPKEVSILKGSSPLKCADAPNASFWSLPQPLCLQISEICLVLLFSVVVPSHFRADCQ